MKKKDETIRLLVPRAAADRLQSHLTRRGFIRLGGAAMGGWVLVACGGDSAGTTAATATTAATGTTAATATTAGTATTAAPTGEIGGNLSIYTWAEYQNPENEAAFEADTGVDVIVDIYESNEAAIAKLELAGASAGYDIVVPTSGFIKLMVAKDLLLEMDMSRMPNVANIDPAIAALQNTDGIAGLYSVVKDWGSTGWVYDASVITEPLVTWGDFLTAAARPDVTGLVSVLGAPGDVTGIVFWRDGIDWNTTDPAHLDHAEEVLLTELAPHLKAFDSYPGVTLVAGEYVLSQAWNGDARVAVIEDPERYKWGLGAPKTELWVDTWAILKSAANVDAAYAWINNILDPAVSAKEIEWHGYDTAVLGTQEHLPADLPAPEIIFFTEEEKSRLVAGEVNEAQDRIVEIYNNLQAAAGV
ncbi:MAG: spermidine/putrescine ABC transporter substrate-binding protein [Acidimicrobiia bacterium]|nr:spermidine/putrescine ABC transporter substrate-binding protein [Acidimicrobiia bacterium]